MTSGESEIFTIGIGGAAGDGVKKAGIKIGAFLRDLGYQMYISFEYPSLIRGGHNFVRITFGKEKIWNDHALLDMLIVSNEESVSLHQGELKEGAKIIKDLSLPKISEDPKIIFTDSPLANLAENKVAEPQGELLDGNTAFAKGLQAAGLDFYIAYPMTPSTSILHYLASKQTKDGLKVIQPENEISAINMALGMAYAGKRAAVGSATGGFALMQEAFSFSGIAELPLAIAISQRQAPATGSPTHSSQSDLRFAVHAGHGEFPRIVIAPGDPEESYRAGADSLNLAWKFQTPVIVMLDKILSEHMMTSELKEENHIERGKIAESFGAGYGRYKFSEDGISPMAFPGTPDTVVKITSYEHDEEGATEDRAPEVKRMLDKRFAKSESIRSDMQNRETVKIYGDPNSENVVVFWGSTKSAVLEAAKNLSRPVKLLQILWLEPFDTEKVLKELSGARKIIDVEANHDGQLASLIRERTGIEIKDKILKYDSLPFDPLALSAQINSILT